MFTSQKWQVNGNAICVVPAESLHDDSHPEYDPVVEEQFLVRVGPGKFAALQRSFDLREAPAGFLEDSNSVISKHSLSVPASAIVWVQVLFC